MDNPLSAGRIRRVEIKPGKPLVSDAKVRIVKVETFRRHGQIRTWATLEMVDTLRENSETTG